ncbi:MAG: methyltransferase domain-containing protein [Chloroflexi bacterium]|nr:methyltransferase domain-containing protein [Chloroflexota bacterium]
MGPTIDEDQHAALPHVARAAEWFAGMVALSATNLGVELGLFDALRDFGPMRPDALAATLGLQPRPIDAWAKVLVQNGLLVPGDGGTVEMAPGLAWMVCEPRTLLNLGPSLAFHARYVARDFLDLAGFFRDGAPISPERHGEGLSRSVAEQSAAMHALFMEAVLPALPSVETALRGGASVLDAGCGEGNLGKELCFAFPSVRYTGVDLDTSALQRGGSAIAGTALESRMHLVAGDLADLGADGVFDLAFFFLSLHEVPAASRPAVMAAVFAGLKSGGQLIIFDESYPASVAEAASPEARMGLHFEYTEMLWGSCVATREEAEELVAGAGFTYLQRVAPFQGGIDVLLARKP